MGSVGNLVLFAAVKEFCKSIKNWQIYSHGWGDTLFRLMVYSVWPKVCHHVTAS